MLANREHYYLPRDQASRAQRTLGCARAKQKQFREPECRWRYSLILTATDAEAIILVT